MSVCLLERDSIASGTTSKSAGIIIRNHKTEISSMLAARTLDDISTLSQSKKLSSFAKVGTHNVVNNNTTIEDGHVDPYELTNCYINEAR